MVSMSLLHSRIKVIDKQALVNTSQFFLKFSGDCAFFWLFSDCAFFFWLCTTCFLIVQMDMNASMALQELWTGTWRRIWGRKLQLYIKIMLCTPRFSLGFSSCHWFTPDVERCYSQVPSLRGELLRPWTLLLQLLASSGEVLLFSCSLVLGEGCLVQLSMISEVALDCQGGAN